MQMADIAFGTTDWSTVEAATQPGETGSVTRLSSPSCSSWAMKSRKS